MVTIIIYMLLSEGTAPVHSGAPCTRCVEASVRCVPASSCSGSRVSRQSSVGGHQLTTSTTTLLSCYCEACQQWLYLACHPNGLQISNALQQTVLQIALIKLTKNRTQNPKLHLYKSKGPLVYLENFNLLSISKFFACVQGVVLIVQFWSSANCTGCPTIEYSLSFGCFLGFPCWYRGLFYHFSTAQETTIPKLTLLSNQELIKLQRKT